ncbi:PE domain-containing protein [Nocardia thailandica]|uniref:PE domain-containing protein n=1 Tax=Nocardia thailandica TaxID=257275 RepID=A0ABW6PJM0_9NOCA|nr:PE domain-containing protein [Nocardia thailandica]
MSNTFEFDAVAAGKAAGSLDALVDRLTGEIEAVSPALRIAPAGVDEVSGRAALTANDVAADFLAGADRGVHEMRKLAAGLRAQISEFDRMETDNSVGFGGSAA